MIHFLLVVSIQILGVKIHFSIGHNNRSLLSNNIFPAGAIRNIFIGGQLRYADETYAVKTCTGVYSASFLASFGGGYVMVK